MNNEIIVKADKVKRRRKVIKLVKLLLLILILLLLIVYVVFGIIYNNGNFTITLDKNLYYDRNLIIYDDPTYKVYRSELLAKSPETFDNRAESWFEKEKIVLDGEGGSHNGDNFLAYTFYIENIGTMITDYWTEIVIDDVIKGIDEAIRVRVYKNGEYITYAKIAGNGKPEKGTTPFDSDTLVNLDHVENFGPGDKVKYTIVIWLDGNDPECTNNILGGEIKIHMRFNSEYMDE